MAEFDLRDIPDCSHGHPVNEKCNQCDLITKCLNYLSKQGCVLWAQHWDISDELEIEGAARWLADVIAQVMQEPGAYATLPVQDARSKNARDHSKDL